MLAPHQIEAVARASELLERRGGLILADEVGLGKSFIAAEVIRQVAGQRSAQVIVPASLVPQWRETLRRFGVEASIVTHDAMIDPTNQPAPASTLLIVDEAHAFRNPRTKRYDGLAVRAAVARILLITATPICNSLEDLHALLRLIAADDLLADRGVPSIDAIFVARNGQGLRLVVDEMLIRRDRADIDPQFAFGALKRSVIRHPVPQLPSLDDLRFPLVSAHPALRAFLRRRLESSEAALHESLRRQLRFYERALSAFTSGRSLPKSEYRRAFVHEEDRAEFQEVLFWELFAPPSDNLDPRAVHEEMEAVRKLMRQLEERPHEKKEMLVRLVRKESEPMLIFTGSAATAIDLHGALTAVRPCAVATSRLRSRESALAAFQAGTVDVLISTDMSSEGLNLQRAGVVVHFDLPWNPVKLDQRNGRAYRIGQVRPNVRAIYFVPDWRETGIMATVASKNRIRRRALAPHDETPEPARLPTLRPRIAADAAVTRLPKGLPIPEILERKQRAGVERLLERLIQEGPRRDAIEELSMLIRGRASDGASSGPPDAPGKWGLEFRP